MREFCKPIKPTKIFEPPPRMVFWFNCRGDCYTEIDNKIVHIERNKKRQK